MLSSWNSWTWLNGVLYTAAQRLRARGPVTVSNYRIFSNLMSYHAEIFHGGLSFSGIWCSFVLLCAVCDVTLWRHIHVSKPTFWRSFWHNMHILLHALPLFYASLHWILGYWRTHHCVRAVYNCKMRLSCLIQAVEHRMCAAGLSGKMESC